MRGIIMFGFVNLLVWGHRAVSIQMFNLYRLVCRGDLNAIVLLDVWTGDVTVFDAVLICLVCVFFIFLNE